MMYCLKRNTRLLTFFVLGAVASMATTITETVRCSVCDDIPDAIAVQSVEGGLSSITCAQLKSRQAHPDECREIETIANANCGCPETAKQKEDTGMCTLCEDGTVPFDHLGVVIDRSHEKVVTCFSILLTASITPRGDDCAAMHNIGTTFCGCPVIGTPKEESTATSSESGAVKSVPTTSTETVRCSVCDDNPDAIAIHSFEGGLSSITCAQLKSRRAQPDECREIETIANANCGCPETARQKEDTGMCNLCEDGSVPFDHLGVVIDRSHKKVVTCFSMLLTASITPRGDDCATMHNIGTTFCGCPANGTPKKESSATSSSSGGSTSMTVMPDATSSLPSNSDDKYTPEERCSLCSGFMADTGGFHAGGFSGVVDVLGFEGGTCDFVREEVVTRIRKDNMQCPGFQATLGFYCGCQHDTRFEPDARKATRATPGMCRICGDQKPLPHPFHKVTYGGNDFTCAEAEFEASIVVEGESSPDLVDLFGDCNSLRSDLQHECCGYHAVSRNPPMPTTEDGKINDDNGFSGIGAGGVAGIIIVVLLLTPIAAYASIKLSRKEAAGRKKGTEAGTGSYPTAEDFRQLPNLRDAAQESALTTINLNEIGREEYQEVI